MEDDRAAETQIRCETFECISEDVGRGGFVEARVDARGSSNRD